MRSAFQTADIDIPMLVFNEPSISRKTKCLDSGAVSIPRA